MIKLSDTEHLFSIGGIIYYALDVETPERIISRKLKGLMAEQGITRRELADRIGISESALSKKINGRREWKFKEMLDVVHLFGLTEVRQAFPELYDSVLKAN